MGHPEDSESYEAKTHVEYCRTGYSEVTILGLSSLGSHKEKIAKTQCCCFFSIEHGGFLWMCPSILGLLYTLNLSRIPTKALDLDEPAAQQSSEIWENWGRKLRLNHKARGKHIRLQDTIDFISQTWGVLMMCLFSVKFLWNHSLRVLRV